MREKTHTTMKKMSHCSVEEDKLYILHTGSATGFPLRLLLLRFDASYHYHHYIHCHPLLSL